MDKEFFIRHPYHIRIGLQPGIGALEVVKVTLLHYDDETAEPAPKVTMWFPQLA